MRLSCGIEDAGDGCEGDGLCDLHLGGSFQDLVLEGKRKAARSLKSKKPMERFSSGKRLEQRCHIQRKIG